MTNKHEDFGKKQISLLVKCCEKFCGYLFYVKMPSHFSWFYTINLFRNSIKSISIKWLLKLSGNRGREVRSNEVKLNQSESLGQQVIELPLWLLLKFLPITIDCLVEYNKIRQESSIKRGHLVSLCSEKGVCGSSQIKSWQFSQSFSAPQKQTDPKTDLWTDLVFQACARSLFLLTMSVELPCRMAGSIVCALPQSIDRQLRHR